MLFPDNLLRLEKQLEILSPGVQESAEPSNKGTESAPSSEASYTCPKLGNSSFQSALLGPSRSDVTSESSELEYLNFPPSTSRTKISNQVKSLGTHEQRAQL